MNLRHLKRWIPLYAAITLALLCGLAAQASPQQSNRVDTKLRLRDIQNGLAEARRLLREDPRRALDMLKVLNDKYPGEEIVMVHLGQMYQSVGEIDSARVMFQQVLAKNRSNPEAGKSLIMLHYSSGEDEQAKALSERLLVENGHSMSAYRMVGTALVELGKYDHALELFRSGRTRSAGHYRLTLAIAGLEKTRGNHKEALSEYLNFVERFPQNYKAVKVKIIELFSEAGVDTAAARVSAGAGSAEGIPDSGGARVESAGKLLEIAEARAYSSQTAGREILDILSSVYLSLELLEKSLETALEADHHQLEDGETLRSLAANLRSRYSMKREEDKLRYYDLALRALEAYIERHPRSLHVPSMEYHLAALFADAGSGFVPGISGAEREEMFAKAIGELDRIFKKYSGSEESALACMKKGDMLYQVRRQPKDALMVYQLGLKTAGGSRQAFVQRIGLMHIILDEYDLALDHFRRYIRTDNEGLREMGIYYTGVLLSFTRKYDAARDTLTALARQNPASPYTNDAIELAWIVEEGRTRDETLLGVYLESIKAELAYDTSGVVGNLQEIVKQGPGATLHSRALFRLGEAYAQMGDYDRAMDYLQLFLSDYPKHDLRPDVHRAIARVYEYGYGDAELALEEYKHILLMYPGYLFLDEVRKDIGRLQPKGTFN
jgi:tetratricopeptide (TPR) repeat protein